MKYRVAAALEELSVAGMPHGSTIILSGHSLGTVFIQDQALTDANISGIVLMGGFLNRKQIEMKYLETNSWNNIQGKPALTIGAELDGLARISRFAESYFNQSMDKDSEFESKLPVVVVKGATHMQFAEGDIPQLVKKSDLTPTISYEQAHTQIAFNIADFISDLLTLPLTNTQLAAKKERTTISQSLLVPLVNAYLLEGSKHFKSLTQIGGALEKDCTKGLCTDSSEWSNQVYSVVANDPRISNYTTSNNYVLLTALPPINEFHHPCVTKTPSGFNVNSLTQGQWEILDALDTGYTFTSAKALGNKIYSRQCILIYGVGLSEDQVDFDQTDKEDFCNLMNQKAQAQALDNAPKETTDRFKEKGQVMTFGADVLKQAGPLFTSSTVSQVDNGAAGLTVVSTTLKTEKNWWIDHFHFPKPDWMQDPGCQHQCMLMSPARAMEWIQLDGLRLNMSVGMNE